MADLRVPDLNKVIVCGRLTRDPELKYTAGGKAWCKAAIANTRYYKGQDGERKEDTTFVDFTVWDKMAEFVGERMKKGRPVIIEGRLRSSEWEDKESGQKRKRPFLITGRPFFIRSPTNSAILSQTVKSTKVVSSFRSPSWPL